eukprot:1156607-Pelagomonas_calceolata.AAC.14
MSLCSAWQQPPALQPPQLLLTAAPQAYAQLGDKCPDVSSGALKGMWAVTQSLIAANRISAGHDISDGGIVTTLCEMAFAGSPFSCACITEAHLEQERRYNRVAHTPAGRCQPWRRAALNAANIGSQALGGRLCKRSGLPGPCDLVPAI